MIRYAALVLILAAFPAYAGELATMSEGGIQFAIDTALFSLGSSDTLLLEVYQELDIEQLSHDELNNCLYTTEITLEQQHGDTLAWDIWNTPVTWSTGGTAVNCTMLPVLHGDWILTVTMTDVNNGRVGTATREFQVEDLGHFSDIEMARTIMPAVEGSSNSLLKGNLIVYPAASTRFTVPGESMIYTYQELYFLEGASLLRHSCLLDAGGVPLYARSAEPVVIPQGVGSVALVDSLDLSVVREPGIYSLSVIYTLDGDTMSTVSKSMFVEVMETAVQYQAESTVSERRLSEFTLFLNREEEELFSRLDEQGQNLYYDNYWNARPGEHQSFLQRSRVVSSRYASLGKQGWQSDRGRVYLIFGEPDEVESDPFSTTQAPYEVWYFYGNEQEMFVFADIMGNGDFLQIHSTVEGEVSNSNWQNMLQNINRDSGFDDSEEF